jgi:arsenate reductase
MTEGFLRVLAGGRFEVASAGTEATRVHPLAIRVMDEVGIDISGHASKAVDRLLDQGWNYVITVRDSASERCPVFPARTTRLHWSCEDPARAGGTETVRLRVFRRIRDEIVLPLLREALASRRHLPMLLTIPGDVGGPALEPEIARFRDDPDPRVASAAREALRVLAARRRR